jgi:hypothetical protein
MTTEVYQKAWKKFQAKINLLRKERLEILTRIYKKFDQQQIESIRKKLK